MKGNIILSIIVLTYNREVHLARVLDFLKNEYESTNHKSNIEIIISDNCSTDSSEKISKEFIKKNGMSSWIYHKNEKNVGLIGNIIQSLQISNGNYIWWWGDDDHYKNGIVQNVMIHLKSKPDYLFLNHSQSLYEPWDGARLKSAIDKVGKDVKSVTIEDLIETQPGFLMFISASIYNRQMLIELHKKPLEVNLALPFYYSIYCAKSGNYILDPQIWVDDNLINQASWKFQSYKVFLYYLPEYIALMPQLGYETIKSDYTYKTLYHNLWLRRLKAKTVRILILFHCGPILNLTKKIKKKLKKVEI